MTDDGGKLISTAYDTDEPDPDFTWDPIGWFESTGEDLGVPADWMASYQAVLAETAAKQAAKAKEPKL